MIGFMSTKAFTGLYLPSDLTEELKRRADGAGTSASALAALVMRFGLERLSDDALRKWAAKQPSTRGRYGGGMTKAEKAALAALERLTEGPVFRLELDEIADTGGLLRKDAYLALMALRARGMVVEVHRSAELDRWGRPTSSIWRLPRPEDAQPGTRE
jgi:hypothetical protein